MDINRNAMGYHTPTVYRDSSDVILETYFAMQASITSLETQVAYLQQQLLLKAPINSPEFTGTVQGVSKSMVGLPWVNNTDDLHKPLSNAQTAALNAKVAKNGDTFTGIITFAGSVYGPTVADTQGNAAKLANVNFVNDKLETYPLGTRSATLYVGTKSTSGTDAALSNSTGQTIGEITLPEAGTYIVYVSCGVRVANAQAKIKYVKLRIASQSGGTGGLNYNISREDHRGGRTEDDKYLYSSIDDIVTLKSQFFTTIGGMYKYYMKLDLEKADTVRIEDSLFSFEAVKIM